MRDGPEEERRKEMFEKLLAELSRPEDDGDRCRYANRRMTERLERITRKGASRPRVFRARPPA